MHVVPFFLCVCSRESPGTRGAFHSRDTIGKNHTGESDAVELVWRVEARRYQRQNWFSIAGTRG